MTVATVAGNTANVSWLATPATGRYVRLNVATPSSNGDPAARIYEFEVLSLHG
jgi:mannosyl-glycoprotein endo-beta-N-acetylglucosaminidase